MHYSNERLYGCRISDSWEFKGLKTVILENEILKVTVLADNGADIYEIIHKKLDIDFMWRTPWGVRNPSTYIPSSGWGEGIWHDSYEENEMSDWYFPNWYISKNTAGEENTDGDAWEDGDGDEVNPVYGYYEEEDPPWGSPPSRAGTPEWPPTEVFKDEVFVWSFNLTNQTSGEPYVGLQIDAYINERI